MNKQDLIKYAALAVGAYLIYKYVFADGGLFSTTPGKLPAGNGTQPPAPPPGPSGQPADTMPPATTAPPSNSTMERIPDETLHRQKLVSNSAYAAAHGAGLKLSADQWNYYRQQLNLGIRDAGELPNRSVTMTAPEYLGWVAGGSLSGLSHPMASGYGISDFTWLM